MKRLTEVLSTYERQYGPVNYQGQGVHVPADRPQPQSQPQRPATQYASGSSSQPRPAQNDSPRSLHSVHASSFESQVSVSDLPPPSQLEQEQMMQYFQRQRQQQDMAMAKQRDIEQQQQQQRLEQQRLEQQKLEQQKIERQQRLEQQKIQAARMREQAEREKHMADEALLELDQLRREADQRERMRQQNPDKRNYRLSADYNQLEQQYGSQQGGSTMGAPQLATTYDTDQQPRNPSPLDGHDDRSCDDRPYDPNLVCPKCGKRYRIGEIQRLRRHVLERCRYKDE